MDSSAAALKLEIARLTGVINRHKTEPPAQQPATRQPRPRSNVYINPNYKPPSKSAQPPPFVTRPPPSARATAPPAIIQHKRDVVIGGIAFESSGRSLVRKDLPKPASSHVPKPVQQRSTPRVDYLRGNSHRPYKSKVSRRGRPANRNMTLDNSRRPYQARRVSSKRKYSDKPCPRFTTTGSCNRGLTCMYQHEPSKIAICWPFLQGSCPNTAETCNLSHDPTPERTPLCVHFANNGRCTRSNCPFPHVRVGVRQGVCRDFAVLGYCEKGLDCDKQHVRECPDFAEKGTCTTKGCKLPHVIRANRSRATKSAATTVPSAASDSAGQSTSAATSSASSSAGRSDVEADHIDSTQHWAQGQLGDEFISLTFNESDSSEEESDDDDSDEEEADAAGEEGSDPNREYEDLNEG